MCTECERDHGHATQCPNNPDCVLDEPETVVCEICGEEVPDEDCVSGVCPACIAKATTHENAMSYGADRKAEVSINGFLAWFFKRSEVEKILLREMRAAMNLFGATGYYESFESDFIQGDTGDFADWLKERKKGGG